MNDKLDDMKGRAKEAAGSLTDNDDLKREGKIEQRAASIKEKIGDVVDAVKDKVEEVSHRDK